MRFYRIADTLTFFFSLLPSSIGVGYSTLRKYEVPRTCLPPGRQSTKKIVRSTKNLSAARQAMYQVRGTTYKEARGKKNRQIAVRFLCGLAPLREKEKRDLPAAGRQIGFFCTQLGEKFIPMQRSEIGKPRRGASGRDGSGGYRI